MSYIGSPAAPLPVAFAAAQAESFSGTGSQAAFTLSRSVARAIDIEVIVNNVQQSPYDGSYSINGTTLTFSENPSAGTNNIYVIYRDQPVGSIVPADGTVTPAKLSTGAPTWTSSGNVGIGTSSPSDTQSFGKAVDLRGTTGSAYYSGTTDATTRAYFATYTGGAYLGTETNHPQIFRTNNTERARIDSSGNLLVGYSSATNYRLHVYANATTYSSYFSNANAAPYGLYIQHTAATPNGAGNEFIACWDATAARFVLRSNGGIANYSANNVNLSDSREKTNVNPAGSYLAKICAIPVRTYNYIDQNLDEDDGLTLGVFAQDVQAVAPELVTESNWGTEEEPKMRLSIYQTDMQYALMKAIQEQQAIIEQLTTRIAALEGAE